jgi:tripartite-type tricarboxylate transporter receptor subunit TctC
MNRNSVAQLARIATLAAGTLLVAGPALAQGSAADFPNRPMRFVVGYPPGGATDIIARIVGQKVGDSTGQNVLIDNRPGAGGILGTEIVAKATPDGYSFVLVTTSHGINPSLYPKMSYDSVKDFTPISQIATLQQILVVNPSLGVNNLKELIALAKAQPGKLNFASSGSGQSLHLSGELMKSMAGINIVHIPYKGSAPARTDLLAGQVQMMFESAIGVLPFVRSGKLRAIAVSGAQRSEAAPDIPTMSEAGLPGFEASAWVGVMGPAGMPRPITNKLSAEFAKAVRLPDVKQQFASSGAEPVGSSPDEFAKYVNAQLLKWAKVVKESGAKLD